MKKVMFVFCLCAIGCLYGMKKGKVIQKNEPLKDVESVLDEQKTVMENIEKEFAFIKLLQFLAEVDLTITNPSGDEDVWSVAIQKNAIRQISCGYDETGWPDYKWERRDKIEQVFKDPILLKRMQEVFSDEAKRRLTIVQQQLSVLHNKK
jgi:hypothetical protein